MQFRRLVLALNMGVSLLMCSPLSASAERWDYLFDNLSWTSAESVGGGGEWSLPSGGFADAGRDWGMQNSGFWDYLFTDLHWPDETFSVAGRLGGE